MKKLSILVSVIMVAIFGLATFGWAAESSFYDALNQWIVRAYTMENGDDTCHVYLEIIDPDTNQLVPAKDIKVNDNLMADHSLAVCDEDEDVLYCKLKACAGATISDISLACNSTNVVTVAYLFYTTAEGLILDKYTLSRVIEGNPQLEVSPSSYDFGDVETDGDYKEYTFDVKNVGDAPLVINTIGFTGDDSFSRNGGDCYGGQTLEAGYSCSVVVKFQPDTVGGHSGTLSVTSNVNGDSAELDGNGVNPAPPPSSDLLVTGFIATTSVDNGRPFFMALTVKNQGTGAAGPFTVKVYVNVTSNPGGTVLTTWNVPGLAAGQSTAQSFYNLVVNGLVTHAYYYFVVEVDAGNNVAETNETNNIATRGFTVAR